MMLSKSIALTVLASFVNVDLVISLQYDCDPRQTCPDPMDVIGEEIWDPTGATQPSSPLFPTIESCYQACVDDTRFGPSDCTILFWATGVESSQPSVRYSQCKRCRNGLVTNHYPSVPVHANHMVQGCVVTPDPTTTTTTTTEGSPIVPSVGAGEDPHFKTWAGRFYDYMGECDLTLIKAPFFDEKKNQTLDIAIRTKIRYQYSYIETAAVKIGDEVLEVSSFGEYALNGITKAELPNTISDYTITYARLSDKVHSITIDLGNGEDIILRTFKDWVSVKLSNPSKARYNKSVGMMGEFGTGKLIGRDGVTVIDNDPNALAAEWQVRDDEPMLFQTARAPQYPAKCKLPDPAKKTGRRLGEKSISEDAAKKACVTAGAVNLEGCIHDVMATGDLELAAAGVF